jgi:hypothetical protein
MSLLITVICNYYVLLVRVKKVKQSLYWPGQAMKVGRCQPYALATSIPQEAFLVFISVRG